MAPMIGKKGKPFCGNHCCRFPQGSGKVNKRHLKQVNKAKEKQEIRLVVAEDIRR